MDYDSIEREVQIDAPVETVWAIVTEPQNITRWFAEEAEVDLRPGGDLVFRFDSGMDGKGVVEKVEPPRLFAFRWTSPEPERDMVAAQGHYTTVEFTLQALRGCQLPGERGLVGEGGHHLFIFLAERSRIVVPKHD